MVNAMAVVHMHSNVCLQPALFRDVISAAAAAAAVVACCWTARATSSASTQPSPTQQVLPCDAAQ
jgi:hypothetical protein